MVSGPSQGPGVIWLLCSFGLGHEDDGPGWCFPRGPFFPVSFGFIPNQGYLPRGCALKYSGPGAFSEEALRPTYRAKREKLRPRTLVDGSGAISTG